jgi:hypothetical protein
MTEPAERDDQQDQDGEQHDLRQLRAKAKRADEVERENVKLRRDLAFRDAGIDKTVLESPHGRLFAKAYDGDPTTDAVLAQAREYGLIAAPEPLVPQDDRDSMERINRATSDAEPAVAGQVRPQDLADWPMDRLMRLRKTNPDQFEALKRGETVQGNF